MAYARSHRLKAIFVLCGAVMAFVVVVQTHLPETVSMVQLLVSEVIGPLLGLSKEMLEGQ